MQAHAQVESALNAIEDSILPSLVALLDSTLDAATAARTGESADTKAAKISALARRLGALTELMTAPLAAR